MSNVFLWLAVRSRTVGRENGERHITASRQRD